MRNRFALWYLTAFVVACGPVAAQQPVDYTGSVQASGPATTTSDGASGVTRLRRPLFGQVSTQSTIPYSPGSSQPASLGQSDTSLLRNTFGAQATQVQAPNSQSKGLTGAIDTVDTLLKPMTGAYDNRILKPTVLNTRVNKDDAPYVWVQSVEGGYIDQTGHCKQVVRGDFLKDWGGKFSDGTPVPKGPVKINAAGHVYRSERTDTDHFQFKGFRW